MLRDRLWVLLWAAGMVFAGWVSGIGAAPALGLPTVDPERGVPAIRHFPPKEIRGGPQVLESLLDADGLLYFTANRSVLIYEGTRWRRVPLGTPRRLVLGPEKRVWVGCDGDLGYLDTSGPVPAFVSLRSELPEDERPTGRIMSAVTLGDEIYFVYRRRIIRHSAEGLRSWTPMVEIEAATTDGHVLWLYGSSKGLGSWTPDQGFQGRDVKVGGVVHSMEAGPDGLLLGTSRGQLWSYRPSDPSSTEARPFSPTAEKLIGGKPVWYVGRLRDGRPAVGSRGSGLLILSLDGVVETHLHEGHGLPSSHVYSVVEDLSGSLWLGTSPGIVRLGAEPLRYYPGAPDAPRAESMLSMTRHRGELYIGTIDGAYRLLPSQGAAPAHFAKISGLENSVSGWGSGAYGLLAGGRSGLFLIEPGDGGRAGSARLLSAEAQTVTWVPGSEVALVPFQDRLTVWRPPVDGAGTWSASTHEGLLPERVVEIVQDLGGFWMVTMGTRTLYRLSFPDGFEERPKLRSFSMSASWPRPLELDGRTLIVDRDRVLRYDEDRADLVEDGRFDIAAWRPEGADRFELKSLGNGDLWVGLRSHLRRLEQGADGTFGLSEKTFGLESALTFDMRPDPKHPAALWLSTEQGPARLDTEALRFPSTSLLIRGPGLDPEPGAEPADEPADELADGPVDPGERSDGEAGEILLPASPRALRFEVSLPYFHAEHLVTFEYRMRGLSDQWSAPSEEAFKEFTNLGPGDYELQVRAAQADRTLGRGSVAFKVLPAWYQSWWARLGYGLVLVSLGWLYVRRLKGKLAREKALTSRERAANRRLMELDALKNDFLTNTSHELRTPLYGIAGLAESLADTAQDDLPEKTRQELNMLALSSRRLSALVDDILDFSRLRHQELTLELSHVDLRGLVDVVLVLTRPLLDMRKVRLINSLPADLPRIRGDENRLQQVLHNLIGNAAKSVDEGRIEITGERVDDMIWVRVLDTGQGIPKAKQRKIFEAFAHEQPADLAADFHRGLKASGLGLAICRRLVELHGGTIRLESSSSEGSVFAFSLPVATRPPSSVVDISTRLGDRRRVGTLTRAEQLLDELGKGDDDSDEPGSDSVASSEGEAEKGLCRCEPDADDTQVDGSGFLEVSGIFEVEDADLDAGLLGENPGKSRILVVDDEPVNRIIAINHLEFWGYGTEAAEDGIQALDAVETRPPDLVLLDIMMPGMSGYDVCRRIRASYSRYELPILFLTAKSQAEDLGVGYSVGANDYLIKPVIKEELLARVRSHLELARMHRHLESLVQERTEQLKILRGMLPICASCKKIRDEDGRWGEVESYIRSHSEAEFSHGLCPDCAHSFISEMGPAPRS